MLNHLVMTVLSGKPKVVGGPWNQMKILAY